MWRSVEEVDDYEPVIAQYMDANMVLARCRYVRSRNTRKTDIKGERLLAMRDSRAEQARSRTKRLLKIHQQLWLWSLTHRDNLVCDHRPSSHNSAVEEYSVMVSMSFATHPNR